MLFKVSGLIIARRVINMDDSRLGTIAQIEEFLSAYTQVKFSAHAGDTERYEHISRVPRSFDYPWSIKRERSAAGLFAPHQRLRPPPADPAGHPLACHPLAAVQP